MTWFFDDRQNVARLIAEYATWRGTPFRKHSVAKGPSGGCDCVGFVQGLLTNSGLPAFQFPRRDRDYSPHCANERVLDYLLGRDPDQQSALLASIFTPVSARQTLMPGDMIILRSSRQLWHFCVMLIPPNFASCAAPDGVFEGQLTDPLYAGHLHAIFRARATWVSVPHTK